MTEVKTHGSNLKTDLCQVLQATWSRQTVSWNKLLIQCAEMNGWPQVKSPLLQPAMLGGSRQDPLFRMGQEKPGGNP